MDRDYDTKGAPLIRTMFGTVSATKENFKLSHDEMNSHVQWREAVKAETGVFCFVPWELGIPF